MHLGRPLKRLAYPLLVALILVGCGKPKAPPPPKPPETAAQPSPQTQPNTPAQTLTQADALLLKGAAPSAVAEMLIRLVGEHPDEASGWNLLSLAYAQMGNAKVAHLVGERAVALAPDNAEARFNAGVAGAKTAQRERAAVHLERAATLNQSQVDPIYMLAKLYEASFQPAEARAAYHAAQTRFPADPDLKRAKAAFETDLTMDGWPDRITISPAAVTVIASITGTVLTAPGEWKSARIVDIGGEAPVLITLNPTSLAVHAIRNGQLIEVGRFSSVAEYIQMDLAIVVTSETDQHRRVAHHQLQSGALVVTREFTYPSNPFLPPTDLVDLFAKVATMNPGAFRGPSLGQEVRTRLGQGTPAQIHAPFLLARADGTYQIELFQDGKVTERAHAELTQYEITALKWAQ